MEDAPAGIPGLCVDDLADLIVSKLVGNSSSLFPPMAGRKEQETLQGFIQGVESVLRCKPGDLAELLEREALAEYCPGCQEVTGRGRKSGQAAQDHLAHAVAMLSLPSW
jgi:hypothetical protein